MKRIIMHWTAGPAAPTLRPDRERRTSGAGRPPIKANAAPLAPNYVAHTRGLNTDSIGIAVCAMHDAQQVPFSAGQYAITPAQVSALVKEVARLAKAYAIPVTRETILSHAEVQPMLGVKQAGKWGIAWIPGWTGPATDPIGVGDHLRRLIAAEMAGTTRHPVHDAQPPSRAKSPAIPAILVIGALIAAALLIL